MSNVQTNTSTRSSLADVLALVSSIVTLVAFLLLPWAQYNITQENTESGTSTEHIDLFVTGAEAIGNVEITLSAEVYDYLDAASAENADAAALAAASDLPIDDAVLTNLAGIYDPENSNRVTVSNGLLPLVILAAGLAAFFLAPIALYRPVYSRTLRPVTLGLSIAALVYFGIYLLFPTPSGQVVRAAGAEAIGFYLTLLGTIGLVAQGVIPRPAVKTQFLDRNELYALAIRYVVALLIVLFALFPVVWIVSASLNPRQTMQGQRVVPQVDSVDQLLSNYDTLLNTPSKPFTRWVLNSVIVSTTTSIVAVFVTSLAAYSFSRFRFRGRQSLLITILLVQVFPNLLAMVAIFLMLQQIGNHFPFLGLNTLGGLIIVYIGGQMGINIWLMKGFFDSIPREIDEAALVDGANHWQIFWRLIMPSVRPILVVVGILAFVGTFNEFVLARVLLRDTESFTLMVGLWGFIADKFAQQWGVFAAGAVLGALPTLIIYLLLQDQIVGGLTQGAVKG